MSKKRMKSTCPYYGLNDYQYWRKSVAGLEPSKVDPFNKTPFIIKKTDKIATAGSCFAQHVARYLKNSGYNYYIAEQAHPIISEQVAESLGYGLFSARYGNIYTSRQLLQLFQRAFGEIVPKESIWEENSQFFDPFRPFIQDHGFVSETECIEDRKQHLSKVKTMFQELDIFVFTLGLTETWMSKEDQIVFPIAPGCGAGKFNKEKYQYHNLSVTDVINDLNCFVEKLEQVNEKAKIILTVSPVPLVATFENNSVLSSTTYSKSVLRVAAEQVQSNFNNVTYFPSYEIITGPHSRGRYFEDDLREVKEEGVNHVMSVFMNNFCEGQNGKGISVPVIEEDTEISKMADKVKKINSVLCDEEQYDL